MYRIIVAICLTLFPCVSQAGQMALLGAGRALSYQGVGDVVPGALVYYSCSRAYSGASANTSTNMCDLVASTGGASVCTIRGASNGYADQSAYCPGSLTPAAACAAASGGSCRVSKMYNQVSPGTLDVAQVTLSSMPGIVFSSSPNSSLPSVDCSQGTNSFLSTSSNPTISQPYSISSVARRPTAPSQTGIIGNASGIVNFLGGGSANNQVAINAGTSAVATASDNVWHSLAGVLDGALSVITVDATDNTGLNAGTTAWGSNLLRVCRNGSGGATYTGLIAEVALWSSVGFTTGGGGQTQSLQSNQHGLTSGYNF